MAAHEDALRPSVDAAAVSDHLPATTPVARGPRARILEVTAYPPPRSGWAVRVEFLKKGLEKEGHMCVVLNIGSSRFVPSEEYESVLGAMDLVRKLWRYSRRGFVVHAHANGDAIKGALIALLAALINLASGRRCYLTFHAGVIQRFFPRQRAWRFVPLYWLLFTIPRRIICNSEAVKECIRGYGIPGRKIVPIPAFTRQYLEFTPSPLPADLVSFFARFQDVVFTYVRMRWTFYPVTMIEGVARVMERRPHVGLVVCGGLSHKEEALWQQVQQRIQALGLAERVCFVDDLDHDVFLTALTRSAMYLRTPVTDGVASSVLESMALGVPVVGSDNGTRPPGVVVYPLEDAARLAAAVEYVLDNRPAVVAAMGTVQAADTLTEEIGVLSAS